MAGKRLSMRKTREIIRLSHTTELSDRQIASACNVSPTTVGHVVKAAERGGLGWPLPGEMSDSELEVRLFSKDQKEDTPPRPLPDMQSIARDLRKKHVTLQLIWEEYRREHPDGYSYSRLCELFREWNQAQDPVMRREHEVGDKMFVDWAGQPLRYVDPRGRQHEAYMFVAVLGASNYIYANVFPDMKLGSWLRAHVEAFEFYGGVPAAVVPDNTKTAVKHPCRYDPELNPAYQNLAEHYDTAVIPARVRKPRDKAKVENAVQNVGQRIIAALRNANLRSFGEAVEAVREKRRELNDRPFSKMDGCRRSLFEEIEQRALKPLPTRPFSAGKWQKAKVYKDYHIQVDYKYYSTPYTFIGKDVEVRITDRTLEIYHDGRRIAVHPCPPPNGYASTLKEHRPPKHAAVINRSADAFVDRAGKVGGNCSNVVKALLEHFPHPEMAFRSCEGVLRLGRRYGEDRLEHACMRALEIGDLRYRHIADMLKNRREHLRLEVEDRKPVCHRNIRGSSYYAAGRVN